MFSGNDLRKYVRNVRVFRAYSWPRLVRESVAFPLDYYFRNGKSAYPMNIVLLTTMRCNLRCEMCNVTEIMARPKGKEISLDELGKLLDNVARHKPSFTLSGGEPFLRNDAVDMVKLIKSRGCGVGAFTNGTLLNREKILGLVDAGLDYVSFSLEGDEKTHDAIVGKKGAFKKLLENLEFFCENRGKTKVVVNATISEKNVSGLEKIAGLGKETGADFVRFNHLCFLTKIECERNRKFCKMNLGREVNATSYGLEGSGLGNVVEAKVCKLREKFGGFVGFAPEIPAKEIGSWYSDRFEWNGKCIFPWRACFVSPEGDVYPCEPFSIPMGNIRENKFMEIWNNEKYLRFRRQLKKSLFPGCARCCKL